jgi:hypothetical protein
MYPPYEIQSKICVGRGGYRCTSVNFSGERGEPWFADLIRVLVVIWLRRTSWELFCVVCGRPGIPQKWLTPWQGRNWTSTSYPLGNIWLGSTKTWL